MILVLKAKAKWVIT